MNKLILSLGLMGFLLRQCSLADQETNLIPEKPGTAANYWCTWYWQNYLIKQGEPVVNPDPVTVYSNQAARDQLTEETVFGQQGMAVTMLPHTRSDYYFLIDHGWQDKNIAEQTFFTLIMDTLDFPRYAGLEPMDRIRQMNLDIKTLGWRGLGLWVRGNPDSTDLIRFVEWSQQAGIEYWKIDGGDTQYYYTYQIKSDRYPELKLEQVTGAGPVNPNWDQPDRSFYPSIYHPAQNPDRSAKALEIIKSTDVFRTYDAAPLLVSTTTLQRVHDLLTLTAGQPEYQAILNIQDDSNIAAALGLLVAVKRHPMNTPRLYQGEDYHLQIAGNRHVDRRLNEMDRMALWQRIAPPFPAGEGSYQASDEFLIDSVVFHKQHTWYRPTHGQMVRQSAPAIMARNTQLPEVQTDGLKPYVMATKFPNGAFCIATEGRVQPGMGWIHPRAEVTVSDLDLDQPIGIFGHYAKLTLQFNQEIPNDYIVWAQDLLAVSANEINDFITIAGDTIILPGDLIDQTGTAAGDPDDLSVPGLVIQLLKIDPQSI